ncbi:MAG: hypothetical protein I3273_02820 [Candidatus Moeniiplasma glomeromycotorum]|nr:hypothetical protein [Candidatus Moeniiplasma glomeromycotorum]MCE8167612.1 hypothetical protein [Candidatus Moeniiplasma glomeromycotorum]MCE8169038.1 hypothetical protein [Candidatus Moeniiplasma glomeromycotorum]
MITRCWNNEPNNRPTTREISNTVVRGWFGGYYYLKEDTEFYRQYIEAEEYNKTLPEEIRYLRYFPSSHSQKTWHSKPINTNEINSRLSENFEDCRITDTIKSNQELETGLTKEAESLSVKTERQLSLFSQTNNSQRESKLVKLDKVEEKYYTEPMEINDYDWQNLNFTCQQTQDWISIGLKPTDANFCAWLRDTKYFTPEQVLNHGNLEQLNQEFFNWWQEQQQTQIEVSPK